MLTLQDPVTQSKFEVRIPYFDHNWQPWYGKETLVRTAEDTPVRVELAASRRRLIYGEPRFEPITLAVREYSLFVQVNLTAAPSGGKTLYRMLAFSNELIGCPPILCYNPTLDAANFLAGKSLYHYFRGEHPLALEGSAGLRNPRPARRPITPLTFLPALIAELSTSGGRPAPAWSGIGQASTCGRCRRCTAGRARTTRSSS